MSNLLKQAGPLGRMINKTFKNPALRSEARSAMVPKALAERASSNATRRSALKMLPEKISKRHENLQLRHAENLVSHGHHPDKALNMAMEMSESELEQGLKMHSAAKKTVKNPWTGSAGAVEHVKAAFMNGFEKAAYNYNQEARELKSQYKSKSKETPSDPKDAATMGGIGVGSIGAIYGGILGRTGGMGALAGAGIGGVAGAAIGIMLGLAAAHGHKESILEAKKILKMAPKKQMDLLKSQARGSEAHENRHEQARLNAAYSARREEHGY